MYIYTYYDVSFVDYFCDNAWGEII